MAPISTSDPTNGPPVKRCGEAGGDTPSFLMPILMSMLLAAVGPVARNTSSRVITTFTGRLALRDSARATGSMNTVVLPPKPPPISDGVTRSFATSMPSRAAETLRIM
jgi:hypothetical protein